MMYQFVLTCILSLFTVLCSGKDSIATYSQKDSAPKYFEKNGKLKGICVDYISEINQFLIKDKIKITINSDATFSRVKADLKIGTIGVFFGITKTKERAKVYDYGDPLYSIQYTFVVPKDDHTDYTSKVDLQGKKIGVLSGTKSADYLEQNYKNVKLKKLMTIESAILMLNAGRIDGLFYHDLGLNYSIKLLNLQSKLKVSPSTAKIKMQYFALSRSFLIQFEKN